MIRFCHRKLLFHNMKNESQTELKEMLLSYYKEENTREDAWIFTCQNFENVEVAGWTNYQRLIEQEVFISKEQVPAGEKLWENAGVYFKDNPEEELLVVDKEGKPLTFCYLQKTTEGTDWPWQYEDVVISLENLGKDIPISLPEIYPGVEMVCIIGCNELAWRIYQILLLENIPAVTIGQEWEYVGIHDERELPYMTVNKSIYFYAEGGIVKCKNSILKTEYEFLVHWWKKLHKMILEQEVFRLKEKEIATCVAVIPGVSRLNYNRLPKADLVNYLSPLTNLPFGEDEETRNRQEEFYDEKAYENLKTGPYWGSTDNNRRTVMFGEIFGDIRTPESKKKRIYLLGPCIVYGCSSSGYYLGDCLQNYVSDYEVIIIRIPLARPDLLRNTMQSIPIRKADIVVYIASEDFIHIPDNDADYINLTELYHRPRKEVWMADHGTMHINGVANTAIAREIYDVWLKQKCEELSKIGKNTLVQKGEILSNTLKRQVLEYTDKVRAVSLKEQGSKKIGAIVMNCNPFTRGHQHLIETAAKQVEFLYVFVVQEEKSVFPFKLRFEMVKRGTAHLSNIAVVPSGNYVLSFMTLPVYFEKAECQEARIDASNDIEIFARYVAPALNITKRFVGEEPTDLVTRQYNEQMAERLPEFGIEFVEMPRITSGNGQIISASKVRGLLKEERWDELKPFVPDTTLAVLRKIKALRFVIYGAGDYGKRTRKFLNEVNGTVVGWLDKSYNKFDEAWQVEAPEQLVNKEYDILIIAVMNAGVYEEIKEEILCIDAKAEEKMVRLYE